MLGKIRFLILLTIIFSLGINFVIGSHQFPLICQVTDNCADTTSFKIQSQSNAHAEIPSLNNYDFKVCCRIPATPLD